jgi:ABC-type branched-subunit amino acid transport system ATPase component/branched-subunit amino acid ABC-type transport system permease component
MTQYLVFLLLGLGSGAVFAALGLALVMTYRSSGVVNFSTGAVALYIAYTYAYLRNGQLLDPIPGLPTSVSVGGNMALLPAVVISLVLGAILGALLYGVVFRPLRSAPAVAKAVASVGVMLVMQALLAARVGTSPVAVGAILPSNVYTFGSVRVPGNRLWFAGLIIVLAIVLILWFRFTRFGLATRAAAETEKGALVSGLSPQRIAVTNWALSTAVAGLSGILIAPVVPLVPESYTLFIVPALAAALVGNFTKIGVAVGAGLAIGMIQSVLTYMESAYSWMPQTGTDQLVPLAVILVFLVFRGQRLPSRGAIIQQTLGQAPRPRGFVLPGAVIAVLGVAGLLATHGNDRDAVITTMILAVICLSQVVVTGFTGQISLAQLTLAGVGAFTLSRLQTQLGVPFPVGPLLAALGATIIGVVVGLPALRIRGLPVAVATLALAVGVQAIWFANPSLDGGFSGAPVNGPRLFGLNLEIGAGAGYPRMSFGVLCLIVLLLAALGTALLRRSRLGASMLAVRANERSAAAAGIDVARVKIVAFAIGGFLAGLGGALMGYQQTVAAAPSFDALAGIALFAIVYLAGVTSVSGGILAGVLGAGGIVFTLLNSAISLGEWYAVISGILLVFTVIRNPEGIVGPVHEQIAWLRARLRRGRRAAPAEPGGRETAVTAASTAAASRVVHQTTDDVLLSVDGAGVRYGSVVAVDNVSFEVRGGEIVGLIGPNGAGKTTLIDAVSGFATATGGFDLGGRQLRALKPHMRSRSGLGRTFQGIELYDDLTVRENVEVGTTAARFAARARAGAARHNGTERAAPSRADIDLFLNILHLQEVSDAPVKELSVGQRQLVSVARALAGRPRVVLLDEPAAGLDSAESRWLGERLRAIRDAGITIVMVDHDMNLVLDVCDRILVLDLGRVIATGTPQEIQRNLAVTKAYLGTTHAAAVKPA